MQVEANHIHMVGALGKIWREQRFYFLADAFICVCTEYGVAIENKNNLQPAVCCDMPISSDSAIQIWHVNLNESCLLMTFHFHVPYLNQPFSLRLWPRYRWIGLINLIPVRALLDILKCSAEWRGEKKKSTASCQILKQEEVKGNQMASQPCKTHLLESFRGDSDRKKCLLCDDAYMRAVRIFHSILVPNVREWKKCVLVHACIQVRKRIRGTYSHWKHPRILTDCIKETAICL